MSPQRRVFALAAERGVTVSAGAGGWFEVLLTAPAGSRFEPGCHEVVVAGNPGEAHAPVWARALARLRSAEVETCNEAGCEWCGRTEGAS